MYFFNDTTKKYIFKLIYQNFLNNELLYNLYIVYLGNMDLVCRMAYNIIIINYYFCVYATEQVLLISINYWP